MGNTDLKGSMETAAGKADNNIKLLLGNEAVAQGDAGEAAGRVLRVVAQ